MNAHPTKPAPENPPPSTPRRTARGRAFVRTGVAAFTLIGASLASATSYADEPDAKPAPVLVCPAPGQPCYLSSGPAGTTPVPVQVPQGPWSVPGWAPGYPPQGYPMPGYPQPPPQASPQGSPQGQMYVVPIPVQDGQAVPMPWAAHTQAPPTQHEQALIAQLQELQQTLAELRGDAPDDATAPDAKREPLTRRIFRRNALRFRMSSYNRTYQSYSVAEAWWGLGFGYRYRFDEHWGIELAADTVWTLDEQVRFTSLPITLSATASFFPLSPVSPYLAAGGGFEIFNAPWSGDPFIQVLIPLGGGLEFDLGKVSLSLDIRRTLTTGGDFDDDGALRRDRLANNWSAILSIGGLFGKGKRSRK